MLPKKNIGAVTVMSAFLGLAAARLCTALLYYSCRNGSGYTEHIASCFTAVGIAEFIMILALTVGYALLFIYSEDDRSTLFLGASVLLSVLTLSAKFSVVSENSHVLTAVSLAMNICILALFGIYAIYYYRRANRPMAVLACASGLWIAIVSVVLRAVVSAVSSSQDVFGLYAVISVISALCYGAAYYSQRQSFE